MELVEKTDGVLCNSENAELQLVYYEKKKVKGRPNAYSFKIGTQISIEVAEYKKIDEPKYLDSWKDLYVTNQNVEKTVTKTVKYYQNDEEIKVSTEAKNPVSDTTNSTSNDPMEVDEHEVDVMRGYMYGTTPVPFVSHLKQSFGEKSLLCIGFSDRKYVLEEHLSGKGCHIVLPQIKYKSSPQKFAALVKALQERNCVIIARKMYNKNSSPKIVALFPGYTKDKKPYLTMIGLHFMEDCIDIKFPSLETNKFKPSKEQYDIMDQLIDSMDLMTAGNEKSGNAEAFALNKTLNPVNQHMCRVIAHRALHPHDPVQKISEELTELIDVPKKIKEMSRETLLKVKELFVLEEIKKPSKMQLLEERLKKINAKAADTSGALSDQTNEQNLPVDSQIDNVGTVTPAEDFCSLIKSGTLDFGTAAKQLQDVVHKLTFQAFNVKRVKITKALVAYREMARDMMRAKSYNDWIFVYKDELFSKDKHDLFSEVIVKEGVGPILSTESNASGITPDKGEQFYRTDNIAVKSTVITPSNDDDDDFMGLIE